MVDPLFGKLLESMIEHTISRRVEKEKKGQKGKLYLIQDTLSLVNASPLDT